MLKYFHEFIAIFRGILSGIIYEELKKVENKHIIIDIQPRAMLWLIYHHHNAFERGICEEESKKDQKVKEERAWLCGHIKNINNSSIIHSFTLNDGRCAFSTVYHFNGIPFHA